MTERVTERGTKTKPAERDIHPNEGKQKKSEPMLKEHAETQNEDRRGAETNVEEGGKITSEDKTDTKTKVEERRTHGTALCVGLICPGSVWNSGVYEGGADHRIIVETMEVLKREYEVKSNGCRGRNQT